MGRRDFTRASKSGAKYSLQKDHLRTGVPQILAYWQEYPPTPGVQRIHMLVYPEGITARPQSWDRRLAVGTPSDLRELVTAVIAGGASDVLDGWA